MSAELQKNDAAEITRRESDIAGLCKAIVLKTSVEIQGKKYVKVEGWQSIATAHGCVAGCRDVEKVSGGYRAIGELHRVSDGQLIASAEGFIGEDEPVWFGGTSGKRTYEPRPMYAIRGMCQTRSISRVCRSAFAHVVVLMDAGLSTTPAEEVPTDGFPAYQAPSAPPKKAVITKTATPKAAAKDATWAEGMGDVPMDYKTTAQTAPQDAPIPAKPVADADDGDLYRRHAPPNRLLIPNEIHSQVTEASRGCGFGKNKGTAWVDLTDSSLIWYWNNSAKSVIEQGKWWKGGMADLLGIHDALVSKGHQSHINLEGSV